MMHAACPCPYCMPVSIFFPLFFCAPKSIFLFSLYSI
jgi:hypothetical protein